jgi:hypothetical protein
MLLERQVLDMDVLDLGRALDLDDVPLILAHRDKDISTGIQAALTLVDHERRLKQRDTLSDKLFGLLDIAFEIISRDVDTCGKTFLGELTHKMTLVKTELLGSVWWRDQLFLIGIDPQVFVTLKSVEIFGFG